MENMIETKDVIQSFPIAGGKELVVLKNINIQIPTGKLTMLRGRSGSGKTTMVLEVHSITRKAVKFCLRENRFKICRNMTGSRCGKRRLDLFFSRWH